VKWFTSATTADMALTLARIEDGRTPPLAGSRGLSLFHVALERVPGGGLRGVRVERLKDKLGTRALPTAELVLDGVEATLLGEPGRGVANIAPMLNVTRYYNAVASASLMALSVSLAEDYALRRQAFGKPLAEHPLHARTLSGLRAEAAGAMALCAELAEALGRAEVGEADPEGEAYLRALLPIAKATLGKAVVAHASEVLECFGGAGYVEDTGIPRLLRDAQVLPIWEGTTNVLSLDLLRAQGREGGLSVLLERLSRRAAALPDLPAAAQVRACARSLRDRVPALAADPEPFARDLTLGLGGLLQVLLLGEAASGGEVEAVARFERLADLRLGGWLGSWTGRLG
jgi:alkylation response protein AidB-like acyl-CoA dehydrogenase